jgi:hypothetical protein
MYVDQRTDALLAACGGFRVEASDGLVGIVETPLFPPDASTPDFLVVRAGRRLHPRRPVVPAALVEDVDAQARIVHVHGCSEDIVRLPEYLPIAI